MVPYRVYECFIVHSPEPADRESVRRLTVYIQKVNDRITSLPYVIGQYDCNAKESKGELFMVPQEQKLLNLLSNNDVTFFIPPYQRNYEWTDEQCNVFLEDVIKTSESNTLGTATEHFFGSVTYFQDETVFGQPDKLVLIDGQQRITTTMLFLVALRDLLNEKELKEFINSKYLQNNNVTGDSEYKIKLKQVETDWQAYKHIILSENLSDSEKGSAVCRNYKYFINKLTKYQEDGNDLKALIDKGLNKFSIITIELQPEKNSWENPQEIFESMNSLGKPLSLADLVRNYLLLGLDADTQTKLYNKYWLHMENILPHKLSDFIRDYMQGIFRCSYPVASEANYKKLYGIFKNNFKGKNSQSLLQELSGYSDIYKYVISDSSCGNENIDKQLSDLRKIKVTTSYSFVMMLMSEREQKKFTDVDIIDILEAFNIYCLRRRIMGLTSGENKVFPTLVNQIKDLEQADDKKLKMFEILSKQESMLRLPNDIELTRYMETMNFSNFQYCKFILSLIEEKLTKNRPDLTDKKLQLEHIMPQKLNEKWKIDLGSNYDNIHQTYVNTIGNLTLIRHNQELGQKPFIEKKDIYENHAGLQIARTKITDKESWNEDSIKERTNWMIEFLLEEVLPIPDQMRKVNNFNVKNIKGLSFQSLQLIGLDINFIYDPTITAHVINDKEVEFEGTKWKLSPLTREIQTRRGAVNKSGAYQGAQYWEYDGIKLADII